MPRREASPERFLTTVVMTDIVGSTEHAAELGDSAWRELLQQHHALIRAELRRHGGREMDTAGDGFFVIFDAPAQAVGCVLAMSDAVHALGLEIRAGVHVGEVQQMAGKVTGIAVVIASRIMAAAGSGGVLVSSTVRDLVAGSGLTFEDRGLRQLKGVPDEWRVYAVSRPAAEAPAPGQPAVARQRRAAAVRRAQARPIWQRRPRLAAAVAAALTLVLVATGLWLWKPWQPAALDGVSENAIGVIDPERGEVIRQIEVGTRPGGIAVGGGYAWVTNTGSDTVSQVDLETAVVVARIDVGRQPTGVAFAEGSVWVANSADRTITRINADIGRVVGGPIEVGNAPTAIAAAGSLVWVANTNDSSVIAVDARTGEVGEKTGVGARPIALAADESALWVVSEDGASISQLDPVTGVTLAEPIRLAVRPTGVAIDADSAWITAADGTVTRIDRARNRILATIDLGAHLTTIASSGGSIWVGALDGHVYRLDPANQTLLPDPISTGSTIGALADVDGHVWLAAQATPDSHRGGTLRVIAFDDFFLDPLEWGFMQIPHLQADGLVGYRLAGGAAGAVLLPALATSIPRPTDGGLTYTFQLRPDLVYSTGAPVRAGDFRRAIERSFLVPGYVMGIDFYGGIVGADACLPDGEEPVKRCDLSRGIVTDESKAAVTFHLTAADPDFVQKLALPFAFPVPERVPMDSIVAGAFPGTGPYTVVEVSETEVRLARNPNFQEFDAAVRPDGFPNEIVFLVVGDPDMTTEEVDALRIAMVESGEADYTSYRRVNRTSLDLFARIKGQYPGQWHIGSVQTFFVNMNASIPPFDNADARRAVNFALDRARMADLFGGPPEAVVTCQLLPPGWPGYQPYCPYTLDPDAGGGWSAADLTTAQRLIDESGTRGAAVVLGPTYPVVADQLEEVAAVLTQLGYQVTVDRETDFDYLFETWALGKTQISINGWTPDYVAPSTFMGLLTCDGDPINVINHCDEEFDAAYHHALELQQTDQAAALLEWAALDHRVVDLGLLAPLVNAGADFVSERVGNYQFNPSYEPLFDQMWVQ